MSRTGKCLCEPGAPLHGGPCFLRANCLCKQHRCRDMEVSRMNPEVDKFAERLWMAVFRLHDPEVSALSSDGETIRFEVDLGGGHRAEVIVQDAS